MIKKLLGERGMKLWVIGMCVIVIVTLSIFSLVLGVQRVEFGMSLDLTRMKDIDVWTESNQNTIVSADRDWPREIEARNTILNYIDQGTSTNRLNQLFQQGDPNQSRGNQLGGGILTRNTTQNRNPWDIRRNSNYHFIQLTWRNPQYAVRMIGGSPTLINSPSITYSGNIWQVFIPLNDVPNRFVMHEWFIVAAAEPSPNINYRLMTWGNLSNLARYVEEFPFHSASSVA